MSTLLPSSTPTFPSDFPIVSPGADLASSQAPIQLAPITVLTPSTPAVVPAAPSSLSSTPSDFTAANHLANVPTTQVWGMEFAVADMQQVVDRADAIIQSRECRYFITANLNYLMLTAARSEMAAINAKSDMNIADGYPIVMRSRFSNRPLPCRVAGSDLIVELARLSADRGYRIFFLGAAPGIAAKAAAKLEANFPGMQVAGCYAPPFRRLSQVEHEEMLDMIRQAKPDILLVAFGQPKGELWIHANHQSLGVPLSIQLGASFDFLAGSARRAPGFWQAIGCEWLYRSICEPKRLAPRYLRNIAFLGKCLLNDLQLVCHQKMSGSLPGVRPWRKSKSQPS